MSYYKPLIVYIDNITNRVYTHSVMMLDYPINFRMEFILNKHTDRIPGRFLYTMHFKSSPTLDLRDLDEFNEGVIFNIIDVQNMYNYPTPYLRPMIQELYSQQWSGYSLN